MLIAFEGPDNVGKSTSAATLTSFDSHIYNATKKNYAQAQQAIGGDHDLVQTFDRIDWLTHMVYRLALPDREWNDDRVRTVFAMPDTHLVFKLHKPELADFEADEKVSTPIGLVNPMYFYTAQWLMGVNRAKDYSLFKSISILEIANTGEAYSERLVAFDSAAFEFLDILQVMQRLVADNYDLLEMFRYVDAQTLSN